jgi:hypothetical protein
MGMGMGMGMGIHPNAEMGMQPHRPNGGGSRTSAGAGPSYDVVHMTARNARLEEKLSKALAKNRSMAKYYDQLLAKTRDAAERELDEVKREAQRMSVELGAAGSVHDQLSREREERTVVQRELAEIRAKYNAAESRRREECEELENKLAGAKEKLSARDAECSHLKARSSITPVPIRPRSRGGRRSLRTFSPGVSVRPPPLAFNERRSTSTPFNSTPDAFQLHPDVASRGTSTPKAQLEGARSAAAAGGAGTAAAMQHAHAYDPNHAATASQMQRLLDQAREERNNERAAAVQRDAEMARQLNDIKEQALERIRESTNAAKEVAALKERLHAAQHERDMLRDKNEELFGDENERRELRRRLVAAEKTAAAAREKADRCDVTDAKLRAAEAEKGTLAAERADAHKRLQEMTERLLQVTTEKDVLVRHSAHQVHVEAELANARRELERLQRGHLATKTSKREETAEWREAADGLGRVLRHHIYGHTRWERAMADEVHTAAEAHAMTQRGTVRLVAEAEAEAAALAGEAIEVVRTTRRLLDEYGVECGQIIAEIAAEHERRADDRVKVALELLREAEEKLEAADKRADRHAAEARRARSAAERAGLMPNALTELRRRADAASASSPYAYPKTTTPERGASDDDDDDDDEEKKMKPWGPADEALTKKLRVAQFQLLGAAMMRKATMEERAEGNELLHQQLLLARREAAVAVAVAEGHERALVAKGSDVRWGLLAAAALRRADKERRGNMEAVEYALNQKTLQLQMATTEREQFREALASRDAELHHVRGVLSGLKSEHDAALRRLQNERGLRNELSDMVKHEGGRVDAEVSIAEVQETLSELAEATSVAAAVARAAGFGLGSDDDETLRRDDTPEDASAAKSLADDLQATRDALLLMRAEDEDAERDERAARASMGALALKPSSEFETTIRNVRRHALEVKSECLAALVDGLEHRREIEKLRSILLDRDGQLSRVRGGVVATKLRGVLEQAKTRAGAVEEKKSLAVGRWGAGFAKSKEDAAREALERENSRLVERENSPASPKTTSRRPSRGGDRPASARSTGAGDENGNGGGGGGKRMSPPGGASSYSQMMRERRRRNKEAAAAEAIRADAGGGWDDGPATAMTSKPKLARTPLKSRTPGNPTRGGGGGGGSVRSSTKSLRKKSTTALTRATQLW